MPKPGSLYRIGWRPNARESLHNIIRYIGTDNPARAISFGEEIHSKVELLAQQPELGRPGRPGLPASVRELVVHKHYIVLYHVKKKERIVEILLVAHTAQSI